MSDEEYLTQDDFDEMAPSLQSRVPLWLMPREEADKNRQQFKLSECFIEPTTGAYLFDSKDAEKFKESIEAGDLLNCSPLVPRLPDLGGLSLSVLKEKQLEAGFEGSSPGPLNGFDDEQFDGEAMDDDVQLPFADGTPTQAAAMDVDFGEAPDLPSMEQEIKVYQEDPYKIMDKHENLPGARPFKQGKTQQKINESIMVCKDDLSKELFDHFCWPNEHQ
eukprot:gene282-144_t